MEADLKKAVRSDVQNDFVHFRHNSNDKGYWVKKKDNNLQSNISSRTKKELWIWIVKKDNRLNTQVTLRMDKKGHRTRYRRKKKLLGNNVNRPIEGSSSGEGSGWGDDVVASNLTKECQKLNMGGHSSWSDDEFVEGEKKPTTYYPIVKDDQESNVSIMDIFPNELHEQILSLLPFAGILRARAVCKMWNEIVMSKKFQEFISGGLLKKPWYFMSGNPRAPTGFIYDPVLNRWCCFLLPFNLKHGSNVASSHGLVCYIDTDRASDLLVCNPMTKSHKNLALPSGGMNFEYHGMAFSVDPKLNRYKIAIVRSIGHDVLINVYSSETLVWNCEKKTLRDWKGRADCVVFNGTLYLLVHSASAGYQHGLFVHDLTTDRSDEQDTIITIPFTITCGRLINLRDNLVMVGGIGIQGRQGVITGIWIWVLNGTQWEEVARVPPRLLHTLKELDDVFASSGGGETIYIHSYGYTNILIFDMNSREWKKAYYYPLNKKYPLQLFTGFCFSPRLDVSAG